MTRARAGFTLIELLVVTVLGSLVLLAALQILITNQRTYTSQNQVIAGQQSTRMALEVLFNELREVSPAGGDLLVMGSDSIRVRLMRKFSIVCETDFSGQPEIVVMNLPGRRFEDNDSVFVFADNDENNDTDDVWIAAQATAVDTTDACPQDGAAATRLRFNGQAALFAADSVGLGAPARSYDRYTFGVTDYSGDPYLGRRLRGSGMVPVVGPIRATNGLNFVYRDALGVTTGTAADVRQIEVTVRTGSGVTNSLNEEVQDSITAWIYTRN
ncbi:MAG: prepilin-type N-terminal cleavage/methylation domain-containing protein [Gemmatimonadota bacterium]|nr:prepilin-type N-terminal cleavage/methylation domain-containing protein [Gemmatimonadota bacterium]